MFKTIKKNIGKIIKWFRNESVDFFQNAVRDLKSIRACLNWIYSIFYICLVSYCVINNPESMNTAISSTAIIVGAIFSAYVFSKKHTKEHTKNDTKISDEELNASD